MLANYTWEPTYLWASLDVNSLYTSILHDVGIQAVTNFLMEDPLLHPKQAQFIVHSTEFCLTHNYLEFNGDYVLQVTT